MLEVRPNCELCDRDLPPAATDAMICSYECTFCAECVGTALRGVCPNCGGGLVSRPIRPRRSWRDGTGLDHDPPGTLRRRTRYSPEEIAALAERLQATPPAER